MVFSQYNLALITLCLYFIGVAQASLSCGSGMMGIKSTHDESCYFNEMCVEIAYDERDICVCKEGYKHVLSKYGSVNECYEKCPNFMKLMSISRTLNETSDRCVPDNSDNQGKCHETMKPVYKRVLDSSNKCLYREVCNKKFYTPYTYCVCKHDYFPKDPDLVNGNIVRECVSSDGCPNFMKYIKFSPEDIKNTKGRLKSGCFPDNSDRDGMCGRNMVLHKDLTFHPDEYFGRSNYDSTEAMPYDYCLCEDGFKIKDNDYSCYKVGKDEDERKGGEKRKGNGTDKGPLVVLFLFFTAVLRAIFRKHKKDKHD